MGKILSNIANNYFAGPKCTEIVHKTTEMVFFHVSIAIIYQRIAGCMPVPNCQLLTQKTII